MKEYRDVIWIKILLYKGSLMLLLKVRVKDNALASILSSVIWDSHVPNISVVGLNLVSGKWLMWKLFHSLMWSKKYNNRGTTCPLLTNNSDFSSKRQVGRTLFHPTLRKLEVTKVYWILTLWNNTRYHIPYFLQGFMILQ